MTDLLVALSCEIVEHEPHVRKVRSEGCFGVTVEIDQVKQSGRCGPARLAMINDDR
jgi:hypothetical protein